VPPFRSTSVILCPEEFPMLHPRAATYACCEKVVLSAVCHNLCRIG
jgi:hypothetical protein